MEVADTWSGPSPGALLGVLELCGELRPDLSLVVYGPCQLTLLRAGVAAVLPWSPSTFRNGTADGANMRNARRTSQHIKGKTLVDIISLALSLGLILGITVFGVQKHASHEQLAKASISVR
jgi:hypothetical protein